jgi:hypothetical protein
VKVGITSAMLRNFTIVGKSILSYKKISSQEFNLLIICELHHVVGTGFA